MKKLPLILFFLIGFSSTGLFAQVFNIPSFNNLEKTREAYFFINNDLTAGDAQILSDYLLSFHGKVVSVMIDPTTQMCTLNVKIIDNQNLIEIILQKGFTAISVSELPPPGFKYVYNPDGTWKLKAL